MQLKGHNSVQGGTTLYSVQCTRNSNSMVRGARQGQSSQQAPNVRRTPAPQPARPAIPAPPAPRAAAAHQATGDGSAEGSAQNGDALAHDVDSSQNSEVDCSQNTGDFDTSGIPVSRRSGDNAKSMLASTGASATFEFDKIAVGFIWT